MPPELIELLSKGGPLGFAGLFAWLWLRSEKKLEKVETDYNGLMMKLIQKAGFDV